jgi:hypothetical protein
MHTDDVRNMLPSPYLAEFDSYPRVDRTQSDSNRTQHCPSVPTQLMSYLTHVISGEELYSNSRWAEGWIRALTWHHMTKMAAWGKKLIFHLFCRILEYLGPVWMWFSRRLFCRELVVELHYYNPKIWVRNSCKKLHYRAVYVVYAYVCTVYLCRMQIAWLLNHSSAILITW